MMDEYKLKLYALKDIYNYLESIIKDNKLKINIKDKIKQQKSTTDRNKITSALIICNKLELPIELTIMLKKKLKELGQFDNFN